MDTARKTLLPGGQYLVSYVAVVAITLYENLHWIPLSSIEKSQLHRVNIPLRHNTITEQECIPVGCVPAERWPYSENWRPPRKFGAGTPPKIWSRPPRKFGAGPPPKIWSRHPPENLEQAPPPKIWSRHPPLWTDTRLWKYYLGQNFVSAGNKNQATFPSALCIVCLETRSQFRQGGECIVGSQREPCTLTLTRYVVYVWRR